MMYDFKWFEETAWFAIVAAITYIAGVAVAGMPTGDWRVWTMTLIAGAARAGVAVVISRVKATPLPAPSHSSVSATTATTTHGSAIAVSASTYTTEPIVTVTPPLPETLPDHTGTLPRGQAVTPLSVSPTGG